ncbi:diaminopimelate epimerase [Candidatus Methylocalor cossyra]|uniref:Diaminopimelate epimerase n=1 Tax=Candidatus Methylocalor cossyra TaxID=3108543 RepID=A0ABP1C4K9_9GAMM
MQGLGNDFVVIDAVRQAVALTPEQARFLADRHFGVGCDQVLVVEPARDPEADFRYRIFNADGGEVAQCGNGARCLARFVLEHGLCDKREIRVETRAGRLRLRLEADGSVTVEMGVPRHRPADIPLLATAEAPRYRVEIDGNGWEFGAVSLGNPHAVLPVADLDRAPVTELGARLARHPYFPEGTNVGFMQILDRHHIRLRVFERGVGETLACGSGACGAAVVGIDQGALESPVRVDLPGGTLIVGWEGRGRPAWLRGPAVTVFEGEIVL